MADPNDDRTQSEREASDAPGSTLEGPGRGGGGAAISVLEGRSSEASAAAGEESQIHLPERLPLTKLQPVRIDPATIVEWATKHVSEAEETESVSGGKAQAGVVSRRGTSADAPSPWASGGAVAGIERAALPSSHAPGSTGAGEPRGEVARGAEAAGDRDREIARLRRGLALSLGVALVAMAVAITALLLRERAPSPTPGPSVPTVPSVPAVPSVSVAPSAPLPEQSAGMPAVPGTEGTSESAPNAEGGEPRGPAVRSSGDGPVRTPVIAPSALVPRWPQSTPTAPPVLPEATAPAAPSVKPVETSRPPKPEPAPREPEPVF